MTQSDWDALGGMEKFLAEMVQRGTWVEGPMIEAAAVLYDRQVVIVSTGASQQPSVIYVGVPTANEPIVLQYSNQNHYISLVRR